MYTSMIIPTLGSYDLLADCVQSIHDHTKGHDYEIIIMDSGNTPLGYVDPVIRGLQAARGELICVINDDARVTEGWLPPLLAEVERGAWVFSPSHPDEKNMKALGWFLCFSREGYMKTGGFDPQFEVWCGDIDLFKRCEQMGHGVFQVLESVVEHDYSVTSAREDLQDWIIPRQREDMNKYFKKWGTDPNLDKLL
jgi:GT2 family glycosyltransferase